MERKPRKFLGRFVIHSLEGVLVGFVMCLTLKQTRNATMVGRTKVVWFSRDENEIRLGQYWQQKRYFNRREIFELSMLLKAAHNEGIKK